MSPEKLLAEIDDVLNNPTRKAELNPTRKAELKQTLLEGFRLMDSLYCHTSHVEGMSKADWSLRKLATALALVEYGILSVNSTREILAGDE